MSSASCEIAGGEEKEVGLVGHELRVDRREREEIIQSIVYRK